MTSSRMAWASLAHERGRVVVSIVGVAFAVVLIFMQLGFLGATERTATILYDVLDFEVALISRDYIDFSRAGDIDRKALPIVASLADVESIETITIDQGLWQNPTNDPEIGGQRWAIVMLGLDPARLSRIFRSDSHANIFGSQEGCTATAARLAKVSSVFLDSKSKPFFGGNELEPGQFSNYNGRTVEFGGFITIGTGFSYTGLLLASDETVAMLNPRSPEQVTMGLVKIRPGADPEIVAQAIKDRLPRELPIELLSRTKLQKQEQDYWLTKTPVGKFFGFGVILALTVGAIFVYQMMIADIKKRLPEYATLKAMGYPFRYLLSVVLWQSLFLGCGGYLLGLLVTLPLYEIAKSQLPVGMTLDRLVLVAILTLGMCVGSALVAVRKLKTADPADLF